MLLIQFISSKTHKRKVNVVPLWVDTQKFRPLSKQDNEFVKTHNLENKFVVMYSGNQGRGHDFETILKTANYLKNYKDIIFLFIGDGSQNKYIRNYVNKTKVLKLLKLKLKLN